MLASRPRRRRWPSAPLRLHSGSGGRLPLSYSAAEASQASQPHATDSRGPKLAMPAAAAASPPLGGDPGDLTDLPPAIEEGLPSEEAEVELQAVPKPRWFTPLRLLIIFCFANVFVYLDRGGPRRRAASPPQRSANEARTCCRCCRCSAPRRRAIRPAPPSQAPAPAPRRCHRKQRRQRRAAHGGQPYGQRHPGVRAIAAFA